MSSHGRLFRITTFGESHGKGVGVIVDGVPPNLKLTESDIQPQLSRRRPGQSSLTTPVRCVYDKDTGLRLVHFFVIYFFFPWFGLRFFFFFCV
jgi:hypothetical protein